MSLYKRGKIWHYDFEFRGQRYKASTKQTSKMLAREAEQRKLKELREGGVEDILFEDLAKKYILNHAASKRGRTFYDFTVRVLGRHFNGMLLSSIGPAEIDAFMAARRAAVKTATANRSLAVLKHMFRLAVRWRHMERSPAADVKLEREPKARERFLTMEEAGALFNHCTPWLRPIVHAALHTGARQGELLGIQWEDVDLERSRMTFRHTKNGDPRTVAMTSSLVAVLRELPSRFEGGHVFRNHGGERVHRDGLTWSYRRAVRLAGLTDFRFHDLRHSAASFMVQAGVPLNTVRDVLGHRTLNMTYRYAHLAPSHQADAVAALDCVGGKSSPAATVAAVGNCDDR